MHSIYRFGVYLVQHQLLISIAAIGSVCYTGVVCSVWVSVYLLLFVGAATYLTYYLAARGGSISPWQLMLNGDIRWWTATLIGVYTWCHLGVAMQLLSAACGVLSVCYSLPFGGSSLRSIPYLKLPLIVSIWTLATVVLPLAQGSAAGYDTYSFVAQRVLFFTAITLPFDVRDIAIDARHQLTTFATRWGKRNCFMAAVALLLLSALVIAWRYWVGYTSLWVVLCINLPAYGLVGWGLWRAACSSSVRSYWFYPIVFDGVMVLQAVLAVLACGIMG